MQVYKYYIRAISIYNHLFIHRYTYIYLTTYLRRYTYIYMCIFSNIYPQVSTIVILREN